MNFPYDPRVVAALPEFHEARTRIPMAKNKLDGLGDIICRHERHDLVGLALLHTHFPMAENERLVEHIEGNRSLTRPVAGDLPVVPYTWQLTHDPDTGAQRWSPVEFLALTPETMVFADRVAAVMRDQAFLDELAASLMERGLADVLGLSLLHRDSLRPSPEMSLLEHTDSAARTLTFHAIPAAAVDPSSMYETLWHFTPGGTADSGSMCSAHNHCSQHCSCE